MPRPSVLAIVATLATVAVLALHASGRPAPPAAALVRAQEDACAPQPVVPIGTGFFTDISAESGIQEGNFVPSPATPVPANDHSRLAFVDLDGDGYDDIVTTNMTGDHRAKPFEHLIYHNNGDGTFADWSDETGLRDVQSAFLAFGDIDNDGDQDAFGAADPAGQTSRGIPIEVLLNDGSGHFFGTFGSGIVPPSAQGALAGNAVLADFDGDGNLDLFVGNGATSLAVRDQLFLGNGDGTFRDASPNLQGAITRASNGSVACDYDNDGDLDIFVSVYGVSVQRGHNVLWENDGQALFTNVARERGFEALATGNYYLASTGHGRDPEPVSQANWIGGNGFGLQCDDVNADGYLDIWIADISHPDAFQSNRKWSDPSQLLINEGPDAGYHFTNAYLDAGLPFNEGDLEASVADFDNDGRPDLAVSRESKYESRGYEDPDQQGWFGLFHQLADGTFESVGMTSGINDPDDPSPLPRLKGGHSNVWSDIDHDGDLDLLVGGLDKIGQGRPNFLFRNDIGSRNAWLAFRLEADGEAFNRDAIGARVALVYPDRVLLHEVKSSRGMYNSSDTRELHFGLGDAGCAEEVVVTWPNGEVYVYEGAKFGQNRRVTIRYGTDAPPPTPTPTPRFDPARTCFLPVAAARLGAIATP